jgi:hypothetical protein
MDELSNVFLLFCPAGILVGEDQRWNLYGPVVQSDGDNGD